MVINGILGRVGRIVAVLAVALMMAGGGSMPAAAQATGTLIVDLVDENGIAVPGACFLLQGGTVNREVCDGQNGEAADGAVTFEVPTGSYLALVRLAPEGYISGGRAPTFVEAGQTQEETITSERGGTTVSIASVDRTGRSVGPACYDIFQVFGAGQSTRLYSRNCDSAPGSADEGTVVFPGIRPGEYIAVQTRTPDGYVQPDNAFFTVPAGTDALTITVAHDTTSPSLVDALIAVLIMILQQILGG